MSTEFEETAMFEDEEGGPLEACEITVVLPEDCEVVVVVVVLVVVVVVVVEGEEELAEDCVATEEVDKDVTGPFESEGATLVGQALSEAVPEAVPEAVTDAVPEAVTETEASK